MAASPHSWDFLLLQLRELRLPLSRETRRIKNPLSHDRRGQSLPFGCRFLLIFEPPSHDDYAGLRQKAQGGSGRRLRDSERSGGIAR
jgi:hypothetical protein